MFAEDYALYNERNTYADWLLDLETIEYQQQNMT